MSSFVSRYREQIIDRATQRAAKSTALSTELAAELALFVDELIASITRSVVPSESLGQSARRQGRQLQHLSVSLAQVVHSYGEVCQIVTELAVEMDESISPQEYHSLNACLDLAIAEAVTAYARAAQSSDGNENRFGLFLHELGTLLDTARLAFDLLRDGQVGISGQTGGVLHRSLMSVHELVEREFASVRMRSGKQNQVVIRLAEFIRDIAASAILRPQARNVRLTVMPVDSGLAVCADRQFLTLAVTNLVQNALKFSRAECQVTLRVQATADEVQIEVEDECGGLPEGQVEALLDPTDRRARNTARPGLGLSLSQKAVRMSGGKIGVRNLRGRGCIFTLTLPRHSS